MGEPLPPVGENSAPASDAADSPPRSANAPRARRRKPEDTPEGCRARAAADEERADASRNPQMRAQIAKSAAAWTARADLLERIDTIATTRIASGNTASADKSGGDL